MDKRLILSFKQGQLWHRLLENPSFTRILCDGGARSTKTTGLLAWLVNEAATVPGARILIARKVQDHAKTTIFNLTLKNMLDGVYGFNRHESLLEYRVANGSLIRIAGLDDSDRVDKILGDEYLHIFVNEATQITWDTLQKLLSRLSQDPPGARFRKLLLDCNPKGPRHWLHQAGIRKNIPGTADPLPDAAQWARMHWTPYDNPFLPADVLRTLEALTGVQRKRLLKGEWCDNEGAVYDEFDENVHVWRGDPQTVCHSWTKVRGVDWGYTNPFACLRAAIDNDGRLWFYRERYVIQIIVQDHAKIVKTEDEAEHFAWTTADHDAQARATFNASGIPTIRARKDIRAGIAAVKARLRVAGDGLPRILFHESMVNTINEFYEYSWPTGSDGKSLREVPIDASNHALDVVRYIVMELDRANRSSIATSW